jgi:hypothetical protein
VETPGGKFGTSNQDRTISLKAAVRSCRNKKKTVRKGDIVHVKPDVIPSEEKTGKKVEKLTLSLHSPNVYVQVT